MKFKKTRGRMGNDRPAVLKVCAIFFGLVFTMIFFGSCATTYLKKTQSTTQVVHQVALSSVQFYRPDFEPAEPDDYTNQGRKLSCVSPQELYSVLLESTNASGILDCLNSLEAGSSVRYRYQSKAQPYLDLDSLDSEATPPCLSQRLPQIILPREIYFLGKRAPEERLECFSMSFGTKTNQVLDAELRKNRFDIRISFPQAKKLKDARDLKLWLLTTLFSVLNEGKDEFELSASVVPDSLCEACFAQDVNFKEKRSGKFDAALWPDAFSH